MIFNILLIDNTKALKNIEPLLNSIVDKKLFNAYNETGIIYNLQTYTIHTT